VGVNYTVESMDMLVKALDYAAVKHQNQRRKGKKQLPYINHPIQVMRVLWEVGQVRDIEALAAALLHDTLEDTDATSAEILSLFGENVLSLVQEVSDDKSLPKSVRKQLQVEHASEVSPNAKMIKLADKICNVYDLSHESPADWTAERIYEYMDWSAAVVGGLRGTNPRLDKEFDRIHAEARTLLGEI
jgi:guanosine-3',5'-bis(diphosphate) 3'-pyrophosphohydrolase